MGCAACFRSAASALALPGQPRRLELRWSLRLHHARLRTDLFRHRPSFGVSSDPLLPNASARPRALEPRARARSKGRGSPKLAHFDCALRRLRRAHALRRARGPVARRPASASAGAARARLLGALERAAFLRDSPSVALSSAVSLGTPPSSPFDSTDLVVDL